MRISAVVALVLAVTVACAAPVPTATPVPPSKPTAQPSAYPMSVSDDAGRQVNIAKLPMRIISIAPSNTEILYALGLGDRVVAVDQFSNFPAEAKAKATLGPYVQPSLEGIVAAQPDLVLATQVHVKTIVPDLEARGLTPLVVDPRNMDEVFDRILLVGKVTGQSPRAERLTAELREKAGSIASKLRGAPKPRVFLEISPQLHTAGPGTFVDDLVVRASGQNIAADAGTQWPQLSQETLIQRDPEVILLADGAAGETPDKVKARPAWEKISAVKNGRVLVIDPDLTNRNGPRVVDGLEAIARALHPERFK